MIDLFVRRTHVAYFSMEIAIRPEMHTYSGGLGVLAGDTARSCADLELPAVFVTLLSRQGYLRQTLEGDGMQGENPDPWDVAAYCEPLPAQVALTLEGRDVWIRPWLYRLKSHHGAEVPILLLDTDLAENAPEDRGLTDRLYGGDESYRLKQEAVLGIGGLRLLRALGFDISTYHMNEGHAALLALDLLRQRPLSHRNGSATGFEVEAVRRQCVFTTHTPVAAGHDRFDYGLVQRVLPDLVPLEDLKALAGPDMLNMTELAISLSRYVNGVAKRHAETSRKMFPGITIRSVTNGVHPGTWTAAALQRLYDRHFPDWRLEPEVLVQADQLAPDELATARAEAKQRLCQRISRDLGRTFDPDILTVGYARRMTAYKRPDLIFADMERLAALATNHPLQIVLAGKAHPRDREGKDAIRQIHEHARALDGKTEVVFLPGYDMALAQDLVPGVDVWLNNPQAPLEASGTSGMKAALNGVLNLSVPDGWWAEGLVEGVTGWAIGNGADSRSASEDAAALYEKLEQVVLPMFYNQPEQWSWMMRQAIAKCAPLFNTHRMMRRYAAEAYLV